MKVYATTRKFPGGVMVIPLLIGCLVGTFIPQVLGIRGPTTGLFKTGTPTLVGLFILCSGATVNFKQAALPLYKGAVLTILKYAIGILLGLGFNGLFGPMGISGLVPLTVITAVTSSNGVIHTALVKEFGGNTDVGAIAILSPSDDPSLIMIALGTTSLVGVPILSLIVAIAPLIIGMISGSLDEDFKILLSSGLAMLLPFNGFVLGANTDLFTIIKAGAGGIVLGLITVLFVGVLTYYLYSLTRRRPDPMEMAIGTTGGNAVAVSASVAMAGPPLEPVVDAVIAQVADAVIITAILTPTLTEFSTRKAAERQRKNR